MIMNELLKFDMSYQQNDSINNSIILNNNIINQSMDNQNIIQQEKLQEQYNKENNNSVLSFFSKIDSTFSSSDYFDYSFSENNKINNKIDENLNEHINNDINNKLDVTTNLSPNNKNKNDYISYEQNNSISNSSSDYNLFISLLENETNNKRNR